MPDAAPHPGCDTFPLPRLIHDMFFSQEEMPVSLALFDLDNTLLGGDSDYLWGCFLAEQGVVDRDLHEWQNRHFYDQYKSGELDILEFLRFQLHPLSEHDMDTLKRWRALFLQEKILPIVLPRAQALVDEHRRRGDLPVIITATNRFITEPIAGFYGVEELLATEPEVIEGRFTGGITGTPCYQQGKVKRLTGWLVKHAQTLQDSWFYSDSHNDLPLLSKVTHPVAVDPDEILREHAAEQGWPIISLRG
jgi:HAD superfamily hydrolase (TIGR01490 family)